MQSKNGQERQAIQVKDFVKIKSLKSRVNQEKIKPIGVSLWAFFIRIL